MKVGCVGKQIKKVISQKHPGIELHQATETHTQPFKSPNVDFRFQDPVSTDFE